MIEGLGKGVVGEVLYALSMWVFVMCSGKGGGRSTHHR